MCPPLVPSNSSLKDKFVDLKEEPVVLGTRAGGGKDIPAANRRKDVRILDIYQNAASAKIDASDWVDYLHLAKWNGRWVIVNVLWELHPRPQ